LQGELAKHPKVRLVEKTRHNANETLYWTKAAAALGLPQVDVLNSELPMERHKAKKELIKFLTDNLGAFDPPPDDRQLIFEGWRRLCRRYGPVFLEKSPHHLHYWSALELMAECGRWYPDINFRFVGLIRNPVDTVYSMWRRWRVLPEQQQYEWLRAYKNLAKFQSLVRERLQIVRYEELVSGDDTIKDLCAFVGIDWIRNIGDGFRSSSRQSWRTDRMFGFQLAREISSLAREFGYENEEMSCTKSTSWPLYRQAARMKYRAFRVLLPMKRKFRNVFDGSR
jgi:hypothetical protein